MVILTLLLMSFEPSTTVVIGDSQAEGLKNAGELPLLGVTIHDFHGRTIAFFQRWLKQRPNVVRNKSLIVFQLGGNDISQGREAGAIVRDLDALEQAAHAINPSAHVVFGLIPVRGQWFDVQHKLRPQLAQRQERALDDVNDWLRHGRHPRFGVFAVNDVVADPGAPRLQRSEFRRAGGADVHLNRRGYRALSIALADSFLTAYRSGDGPHRTAD